jgi:exopolysaccharide production protein ExoY
VVRQYVVKFSVFGGGTRDRRFRTALGGLPKCAVDFCVAGTALILLSPRLLIGAALIRIATGHSAFVAERKIGFEGRLFKCYRFRTHCSDRAQAGEHRADSAPDRWRLSEDQPLAEAVGACLTASGFDKLPQLLNVLRGDMSLIGPQLIAPEEFARYCSQAPEFLLARPGMIGLWMYPTRRLCSHASSVARDSYYVNNWSMWLDLKILGNALVRSSGIR